MHFGLSERHDSGLNILRVRGELDVLTVPRLAAELNALIRRSDGDVAIDLRGASFIDSAGLHILLNAHRRLSRASRRLSVICRDGPVKRVIELARLLDTLDVVDGVGA